jgi:hypothetical protein
MDIDVPTGTISIYNMQVTTLEAGLAEVKMQSEKIEKDLAKNFEDMAKLNTQFKTPMIVMQGCDLVNIHPQINRLQTAILKDMEAYGHLHTKVTKLCQQTAPVKDWLQTLFSKVRRNND